MTLGGVVLPAPLQHAPEDIVELLFQLLTRVLLGRAGDAAGLLVELLQQGTDLGVLEVIQVPSRGQPELGFVLLGQPLCNLLQAGSHYPHVGAVRLDGGLEAGIPRPTRDLVTDLLQHLCNLCAREHHTAGGNVVGIRLNVIPKCVDGRGVANLLEAWQRCPTCALEGLVDCPTHVLPGRVHPRIAAQHAEEVVWNPELPTNDKQAQMRLVLVNVGGHDHLARFHQPCDLLERVLGRLAIFAVDNL
mmetsp:Transcript_3444/g.9361  ORF Transcript_3444/g.9361 Transcript_3444/m.9361 type:complete len:246 (-) Transcript_3444:484-1221(-)